MTVRELAKQHRVKFYRLYQILYDLEATGKIKPERKRKRIILKDADVEEIRKELNRLGFERSEN